MNWLAKIIEPKVQIEHHRKSFSNQYLIGLILPLIGEQFMVMLVGIADTLMISYAGEAAVSGITLVNMFTTIFIYIFTALAAGGSVIVSQYVGKKDKENGDLAASQIITVGIVVSTILMMLVLGFYRQILSLLFGEVDQSVMTASITYLKITAYSFPAMAIYSGGAALYRSMGKTKAIMHIAIVMNLINVVGNAIGVYLLHAGVAGVAWPSFISRTFAAVYIIYLCYSKSNTIQIRTQYLISWNRKMIKTIMGIAVPNGIESGIFQLAKVALSTITALFGTSQIAANGVAQSFWSLAALIGIAMGSAFITVIGQCVGAKDYDAADYYMHKLLRISLVVSIAWNAFILGITPIVLMIYQLPEETKRLVFILVMIHNVFNALVFPVSSPFSNGLRAAGDVKYTMYISIFSTVVCRVILSAVFGIWMNLGVIGIALAMVCDWSIRAYFIVLRYKSNIWKTFKVI
jgi:putative MATE family efflux protein